MDIPEDGIRSNNTFDAEFASAGEWARLYRAHAVQIVPACAHGEVKPGASWKRPLMRSWTEYQEALVPQEQFDQWYGTSGQYVSRPNMGAICGRASGGMFVVDLDTYKHPTAAAWWQGLLSVHNNRMELETPEQRTGGGGYQKLFRAPPGWTPPTCKTSIGVDIRGQGGFAMFAPSMHESGRSYEWLDGLSPDDVDIMIAPDWLVSAVNELVVEHGGGSATNGAAHLGQPKSAQPAQTGQFDGFGHQTDGREDKMYRMVWRIVVKWHRQCPIKPSDAESAARCAIEYDIYERGVKPQSVHSNTTNKADALDAEGRGPREWGSKWRHAMKQWEGKVRVEAAKPDPHPDDDRPNPVGYTDYTDEFAKAEAQATPADVYPFLDVDQIMDKPDPVWVVDGLINERALGFIFGPPSSLKTFIALDLSLSMAAKAATWWDRKINRQGAVVYLCREGTSSFKFRIKAWEMHRKMAARGIPFYLIEHPTNFMKPEDVAKAVATIEAIMAKAGVPVAAVVVDTVSRVLPGAEENLQKDMSLFVGACEIIQTRFQCIVIGVHHTNKNGGIRGSTVIPGAGDFLIETRRETGAMTGSIVLQKVKDGEDGVELPFKVTKLEWTTGFTSRSSLAVDPDGGQKAAPAAGDGLPDMTVCREILAALAQAWFNKMPWCKSANGDRPAVTMIMNRWMLKREAARRLMDGWLANGIVEYDYYDKRNRLRGYRKVTDL